MRDDGRRLIAELAGNLGLGDVADVRVKLLKCLAEQPEALLIDLSRMTLADPLALSVFVAVRRQAARWPGIPMLLCAPEPQTGNQLRSAAYRTLPRFTTLEAAREHARLERHTLSVLSDELLPISGAARQARNVATDACVRWDLPDLVAPASLVASELVSNVVDHAHTMMTLRVTLRPRFLHIAVRDGDAAEPVLRATEGSATMRGRGLLLVEATAHSWGWLPTDDGKVVWASLQVS
ncbi:ATP-binding protein [Actinoplanes sp. NPDC048791]|uniref:ATP-binding protein n=1 Tax=Actinoplanes sp. NPDC048791 TaxID=3154623 RepID=UPI0033D4B0A2